MHDDEEEEIQRRRRNQKMKMKKKEQHKKIRARSYSAKMTWCGVRVGPYFSLFVRYLLPCLLIYAICTSFISYTASVFCCLSVVDNYKLVVYVCLENFTIQRNYKKFCAYMYKNLPDYVRCWIQNIRKLHKIAIASCSESKVDVNLFKYIKIQHVRVFNDRFLLLLSFILS